MGAPERAIIDRILGELDPETDRLFRINAGMGWAGEIVNRTDEFLVLKNPRPLYAAPEGWPDLCGWKTVEITPEMVGKKLAVFRGVEVKTGRQTLRQKQKNFRDVMRMMGAIWDEVRE